MNITVREVRAEDCPEWLRMRRTLWDDCPDEQQVCEMEEILARESEEGFVAEGPGDGLCGFVEAAIRPWAIGCEALPVGYVEGWYIDEELRRRGVGRAPV